MYIKCNKCGKECETQAKAEGVFIRYSRYSSDGKRHRPMCIACKRAEETINRIRLRNSPEYKEKEREKNRAKRLKYYKDNLHEIKNYLGGTIQCSICGYTDECFAPFDFHHLDHSKKEFGIHKKIDGSPFKNWSAELDKCILVCSNCHRKIHSTRCTNEH